MIEVELKFEVKKKDLKKIIGRLLRLGFETSGRLYEKTVMYDNEFELMQKTNGRIRFREIGLGKAKKWEFSYKRPLVSRDGIKREIEYEIETLQGDELAKILHEMQWSETTSYERYRTTLKNEVKVTIDEYPFASFIEIEGKKDLIEKLALEFGFDKDKNLVEPCDTLFTKWREAKVLKPTPHMLFSSFNK